MSDDTLYRAMAQLEHASSGSMAIYRSQLATVLAAARRSLEVPAAPAPLADAELAELANQAEQILGLPWRSPAGAMQVVYGAHLAAAVFVADTHLAPSPEEGQRNANYLAAAANALPGLLARLAAAEAPKWIAVGERLPVDEIDNHDNPFGTTLYLVARPGAAYVSTNALAYRYDGDWFIVQEGAGDDADFVDNSVTHWQPLPAAPQSSSSNPLLPTSGKEQARG